MNQYNFYNIYKILYYNFNETHNYGFYDDWCCTYYSLKGKANSLSKTINTLRKKSVKFNGECKVNFVNFRNENRGDMAVITSLSGNNKIYITPRYILVDGQGVPKKDKVFHVAITNKNETVQLIADDINDFIQKFNDRFDLYQDYMVDFL